MKLLKYLKRVTKEAGGNSEYFELLVARDIQTLFDNSNTIKWIIWAIDTFVWFFEQILWNLQLIFKRPGAIYAALTIAISKNLLDITIHSRRVSNELISIKAQDLTEGIEKTTGTKTSVYKLDLKEGSVTHVS